MECVQHEAKAMGKELLKPVTEPWSKGEYAEAITAGGLELALIVGPIVAKIGGMMKAAQATRAAEIARAEALRAELAAADAAQRAKLASARASKITPPKQSQKSTGVGVVNKPPLKINVQKQAGHVKGTPQHKNRVKQNKPTSTFDDAATADRLTLEAWDKGQPVPGRPGVKDYDFGTPVGEAPGGGTQSRVRVHMDSSGEIHGHPSGPVTPQPPQPPPVVK
jgi:hypothetical protein